MSCLWNKKFENSFKIKKFGYENINLRFVPNPIRIYLFKDIQLPYFRSANLS